MNIYIYAYSRVLRCPLLRFDDPEHRMTGCVIVIGYVSLLDSFLEDLWTSLTRGHYLRITGLVAAQLPGLSQVGGRPSTCWI